MLKRLWPLLFLAICLVPPAAADEAASVSPARPVEFEQALDLIHAFGGTGDELQRAAALIRGLAEVHPRSGYAETLQAEALSTWDLGQRGTPIEVRYEVLRLADEAIRLNPRLAQAHVARARAYVRASIYDEAEAAIAKALEIEPGHAGALFLKAEIHRRQGAVAEGETWYRAFIAATPSPNRKRNGYSWIATMYEAAAERDPANRRHHLEKARQAYEGSLSVKEDDAWGHANFAVFLNDQMADFDAAARHAERALALREFPTARYHLAAARYQKLWASNAPCGTAELRQAARAIAASTGISLDAARAVNGFSDVMRQRLYELQRCLQGEKQDALLM